MLLGDYTSQLGMISDKVILVFKTMRLVEMAQVVSGEPVLAPGPGHGGPGQEDGPVGHQGPRHHEQHCPGGRGEVKGEERRYLAVKGHQPVVWCTSTCPLRLRMVSRLATLALRWSMSLAILSTTASMGEVQHTCWLEEIMRI